MPKLWGQKLLKYVVAGACLALPAIFLGNTMGLRTPTRSTGGGFPEERSCSRCHGGLDNAGPGSVVVTIDGKAPGEYQYKPGEKVPVSVRVAEAGKKSFGFQMTARNAEGCVQAGTFEAIDNTIYIERSSATPQGCQGSTVQFPMHAVAILADGAATFHLNWIAPPSDFGLIRFAAAGVAADGDGKKERDNTYTWEGSAAFAGGAAVKPVINSGGVVLATGTPVVAQLAPNAIGTVYGQEFAPAGTSVLSSAIQGDRLVPQVVAQTCVLVNGVQSSLFAVTPNQINFQVPASTGLGVAEVRVVRGCGTESPVESDPEMITVVSATPAFFNFTNALDGVNPIAAINNQDNSLLAPEGFFGAAAASRPATPGEYVSLFGTGFGHTNPPIDDGRIPLDVLPNGQAEVADRASVRVRVGGVDLAASDIFYAGTAPCCAGLNQLVIRLPEGTPPGSQPVDVSVAGVTSPGGPHLAVAAK